MGSENNKIRSHNLDSSLNSSGPNNGKYNICKKLSSTKIISGICNTAFTLEEKLNQNKGNYDLFDSEANANKLEESNQFKPLRNSIEVNCALNNLDNDQVSIKINDKPNSNNLNNLNNLNNSNIVNCLLDKNVHFLNQVLEHTCCGNKYLLSNKSHCLICKKDLTLIVPDLFHKTTKLDHENVSKINCQLMTKSISSKLSISSIDPIPNDALQSSHQIEKCGSHISKEMSLKKKTVFSACKGLFMAFISSIFFSLAATIVKYVHEIDAGQMAIYRFIGMMLFSFPVLLDTKKFIFAPSDVRHWVLLRGLAGATSLYLRFSALHYLPMSNATVIVLSQPVFVCIFGRIFLKEACGIFHVIALAVTFVGIAFTSKLDVIFNSSNDEAKEHGFDRQSEIYGLIYGLGSALIGSSAYILVRTVKKLHYSEIMFNYSWVALSESLIITYTVHDGLKFPEGKYTPWLLVGLAVLSFYGQMLITRALQAEEAGLVSVVRSASEVFFAFLFQILIFSELPTASSVFGAVLVTTAVMLTSARKYVLGLPDKHLAKRLFWFTLK